MSNKIQGEGDYEAARRFNKAEQDFVKRKLGKKQAHKERPSDLSIDAADEFDAADEDEQQEALDGDDTTKRLWRPGIEFPRK